MAETQSTTPTNIEATAPTGDIKVFIDAFNKDFDAELKKLVDAQQNYKNVYADAIKITTPKEGPWPNDPKVVTIGDLFKYTFPDIESDKIVVPPSNNLLYDEKERENYRGWSNDIKNSKDEKIKTMYSIISSGIRSNKKIENYQSLKKPGITNPSLWSPGQYYFDIFMYEMLSPYGPLKDPTGANGGESAFGGDLIEGGGGRLNGWLKANGGSASVSNFNADGIGATGSFGYINFYEIIDRGYVDQGVKYRMINSTGIDINLDDADTKPPKSFPSLFTQYRTGPLSEFISFVNSKIIRKDPKFNIYEGIILNPLDKEIELSKEWDNLSTLTDLTGYKFVGYYEHMLLYKAFIQAGDNYKSVVLPLRNPEPPAPAPEVATKPIVNLPQEVGYTFNVEKKDSFVIVGGGSMSGIEFTIVPNDGTTYIISTPDLYDELPDEEYMEEEFLGTEEEITAVEALYSFGNIDDLNLSPAVKAKAKKIKEKIDNADDGDNNSVTAAQLKNASSEQDFWTLVAICSREDGNPQAWCDIAQSIYNRIGSGAYNAKNITTLISLEMQYEPTWSFPRKNTYGKPNHEWKKCLDINSASAASGKPVEKMKEVAEALKNKTLQQNSKSFIAGRTDFLGITQPAIMRSRVQRIPTVYKNGKPVSGSNYFGWKWNYSANVSYSIPHIVDTISIA
jgi:hypothetical protein